MADSVSQALAAIQSEMRELYERMQQLKKAEEALLPLSQGAVASELSEGVELPKSQVRIKANISMDGQRVPSKLKRVPKGKGKMVLFLECVEKILREHPDKFFHASDLRSEVLRMNPGMVISDVSAYLAPTNTASLTWLGRKKMGAMNLFALSPTVGGKAFSKAGNGAQ